MLGDCKEDKHEAKTELVGNESNEQKSEEKNCVIFK